jgi:hypothetical protein
MQCLLFQDQATISGVHSGMFRVFDFDPVRRCLHCTIAAVAMLRYQAMPSSLTRKPSGTRGRGSQASWRIDRHRVQGFLPLKCRNIVDENGPRLRRSYFCASLT